MKDRGKAAAVESDNNNFSDFNYYVTCMKHPNSSSIGICSDCLKERLVNLVCSECGEQRLSSCSCSDDIASSNRNSCSVEVGSVGRISFLLENEKNNTTDQIQEFQQLSKKSENDKSEQVILLRSSSNCVAIKKNRNGFWKIKRLFKKKREKGGHDVNSNGVDEKSDIQMGVSRSRSLCSFRNGGFNETDDYGSDYRFSSAKISDVTGGLFFDSDEPRKSGFSNNVPNKGIFPVKESDFSTDDSDFIDLKLDLLSSSSEVKTDYFSGKRLSNGSDYGYDLRGGSCRITTVNEYDTRMKSGKGNKVLKWIFNAAGRKSTSKRDEDCNLIIKS